MRISVNNWDIEVLAIYEITRWQFGVEVLQIQADAISRICWLINADVQLMSKCNYNHIRSLVAIEITNMFYFVAININTSPYNICNAILVAQNMCVALPYWEIVLSSLFSLLYLWGLTWIMGSFSTQRYILESHGWAASSFLSAVAYCRSCRCYPCPNNGFLVACWESGDRRPAMSFPACWQETPARRQAGKRVT